MFVTYSPPYLGLYIVGGLVYWCLAFLVSRRPWVPAVYVALLGLGLVGYAAYHALHPGAEIQVFKDYERVTPFHVQLAPVWFGTLAGAVLISVVRSSSGRGGGARG